MSEIPQGRATGRIDTFGDFWPYYLRQHARPGTRAMHYAGTGLALILIVMLLLTLDFRWAIAAIIIGYGLAWIAHFLIAQNRPAAFGHPIWSLICDFRMLFTWLSGKLPAELARAGVMAEKVAPP